MHTRIARPLCLGTLALASALALTACEEQPVGSFKDAEFVNEGSRAKTDLYFQPGGSALRPGEAGRLHSFLSSQLLSPETDILIHVGSTGSPVLDARRRGTLKASMPRTPARVRLVRFDSELGQDLRTNVAQVEVVQYDRINILCPGNPAASYELTTPLPNQGCSNAINLALEADQIRDLTAPRDFHGSDGVTSVGAVERLREGKVITTPLGLTTGDN
ncbi:MAG: CpaD family pilus assembly lipoprotein [Amaricoccus sp.]